MSDLIDRQTAIELIHSLYPSTPIMRRNRERWEEKYKPYIEAEKALEMLPSAQPERKTGRWIPCSERLPEEGQIVLATHLGGINPNRQVIEHIYSGGEFLSNWDMDMEFSSPTFGERYMGAVVAWMPLPEPYREGEG